MPLSETNDVIWGDEVISRERISPWSIVPEGQWPTALLPTLKLRHQDIFRISNSLKQFFGICVFVQGELAAVLNPGSQAVRREEGNVHFEGHGEEAICSSSVDIRRVEGNDLFPDFLLLLPQHSATLRQIGNLKFLPLIHERPRMVF
ncbi:hypothetical protein G5S34_17595 [Herbaspirillum frisingense]|uniref:hypothetical protein n=1 Tax=Herbaspirillum frisingense TaxID=92645 RepID=UPI001600EED7|nr:hypothetical protein [Herbaspirillum frisingense]QNB08387.1 hypothetical protein G5S34_17595 [Herbaspirillum frisingense]